MSISRAQQRPYLPRPAPHVIGRLPAICLSQMSIREHLPAQIDCGLASFDNAGEPHLPAMPIARLLDEIASRLVCRHPGWRDAESGQLVWPAPFDVDYPVTQIGLVNCERRSGDQEQDRRKDFKHSHPPLTGTAGAAYPGDPASSRKNERLV